jgi:hypothetical protein
MAVVAHERVGAVRSAEERGAADRPRHRVHVRDHDPSARTRHARQLGDRARDLAHVIERERAHHEVERRALRRERTEIAHRELSTGRGRGRAVEHRGRGVDAGDLVAEIDEMSRVSSGTTRGIERAALGWRVEQLSHDRLLDRDQRVPGPVVGLGPRGVPGAHVELGHVAAEPERGVLRIAENALHLRDARVRVLVAAGEQLSQEREAFDAEQELAQPDVARGHVRVSRAINVCPGTGVLSAVPDSV